MTTLPHPARYYVHKAMLGCIAHKDTLIAQWRKAFDNGDTESMAFYQRLCAELDEAIANHERNLRTMR